MLLLLVALLMFAVRNRRAASVPKRKREAERISLLSPEMRERLARLLAVVYERTGVMLVVGSTVRTIEEQEKHFREGRSRARGASAPHVRGIAVDLYVPPGSPPGTQEAWRRIARDEGWHVYSGATGKWDPYHAEWRG